MPDSPSYEFQKFVLAQLEAASSVTDLVGTRIYGNPPDDVDFPYIRFGRMRTEPDDDNCRTVDVCILNIDVFSRKGGWGELRTICHAVKKVLHDLTLTLTTNALCNCSVLSIDEMDDPRDNITVHGVVVVEATIEDKT